MNKHRKILIVFLVLYVVGWIIVVPETQMESANFINRGLGAPIKTELATPSLFWRYSPYYRTEGVAIRKNLIGAEGNYDERFSSVAIQIAPFVVWYSVEFYSSGFSTGSSGISFLTLKGVQRKQFSAYIT